MPHAYEVVTRRSCSPPVAFNERMDPIQPPQAIGGENGWVRQDVPVLVNNRQEVIDVVRNFFEMRWYVVANVNRLLTKPPAELSDIGYCGRV